MTPRKVLICGSRNWPDRQAVVEYVQSLPMGSRVIVGGARGVDTWAEKAAEECGLDVSLFVADWESEGKRAGILRNLAMLDEGPDTVVAFRFNESPGTSHTVKEAKRRGIVVDLHELIRCASCGSTDVRGPFGNAYCQSCGRHDQDGG